MHELTNEQLKKLVSGRFQTRKCLCCDGKGWYWITEDGEKLDPKPGESSECFDQYPCNFDSSECGGLGFRIIYDE